MAEQGLWTGGHIFGYGLDPDKPGHLSVNHEQAKLVRTMFREYLELGSVGKLVKWLSEKGHRTPTYLSRRGKQQGGRRFIKTSVIRILTNPTYLGKLPFKEEIHEGKQRAIVPSRTSGPRRPSNPPKGVPSAWPTTGQRLPGHAV